VDGVSDDVAAPESNLTGRRPGRFVRSKISHQSRAADSRGQNRE